MLLRLLGGSAIASVGPCDAQELLRVGRVLVDGREQGGWDAGHAPNAEHRPLGGLATSTGRLSKDRTLVVACRSGEAFGGRERCADQGRLGAVNLTGGLTGSQAACPPILNRREKDQ